MYFSVPYRTVPSIPSDIINMAAPWDHLGPIGAFGAGSAENANWWRRITLIWGALSLLVVFVVEISAATLDGTNFWERHGFEREAASWCEASGSAYARTESLFIRESSNARSDYSYVSVGIGMITLGVADALANRRHRKGSAVDTGDTGDGANALLAHPEITLAHGVTNILHGFGTFWFHACQCSEGGRMDVAGMLAVVAWPAVYSCAQLAWQRSAGRPCGTTRRVARAVATVQLCLVPFFHGIRADSSTGMFVLVLSAIAFVVGYAATYRHVTRMRPAPLIATILLFIVGLLAWNADQEKLGAKCNPDSWVQGHAAWHVLTCFAIITLYVYFRTEVPRDGHSGGVAAATSSIIDTGSDQVVATAAIVPARDAGNAADC